MVTRLSFALLGTLAMAVTASAHIHPVTGQDYRDFLRNDGKGSCCD